jgi:hypothetical protein
MTKTSPTTATRLAFLSLALIAIAAGPAAAATSTWTAAGSTSNFSDAGNWDAPPTPNCIMVFPAGPAFSSKGAPVNDQIGLTIDQLNVSQNYDISGLAITCKNINISGARTVDIRLPISTEGSAVLTVTVSSASGVLNLHGRLSGAGPVTYSGLGVKRLSGTANNTLTGLSSVAMGTLDLASSASESIAGPLTINSGGLVLLTSAPEIKNSVIVTVNGILDLSAATGNDGTDTELVGGLAGTNTAGIVKLGAKTLGCAGQLAPTVYIGSFEGTGAFRQSSSGVQVLSGTSFPYTGTTRLAGGSTHIWGQLLGSPVVVTSGTLVLAADCGVESVTLSGSSSSLSFDETISAMTMSAITENLTVGSGSGFEVVSKSPTDYSTIETTIAASINGAVLVVDTSYYTPTATSVMVIIENTGPSPISGTFAGLAEGATVHSVTNTATTFTISYVGGTGGNDVTLTGVTAAVDVTGPSITTVAASGITDSGATITWTTGDAADSQVEYGLSTAYGSRTTLDTARVTSHSVGLTGLAGGTTYHYRVLSRDADGNRTISADHTFSTSADVTDPAVATVATDASTASGTAATVTWTTDEASDSQVAYGLTTAYGTTTTLDTSMVTAHSVDITGLAANTLYHYQVTSTDAAGNATTSADGTFTTSTTPAVAADDDDDNGCGSGSAFGLLALGLLLAMGLRSPVRFPAPRD